MKIAFDAKRFFNNSSGLGNYSRDLVRILATFYPDHQYLLFNKNTSERGESLLKFPNISFQKTSEGSFSRQLKMGKDAQKAGAAIFHGLSGELPLKWRSESIRKVVTIHDLIFVRFPQYYSFFDRKMHFWKFRKAAEQSDLIIAISEQTKKDIIQYLKIPESKIKVIYQGCHETFKKTKSEEFIRSVRSKYSLPEKFILSVGTIEERKNLLNILKALNGTEIPLVAVGKKTGYFRKIENYTAKNQMQGQVYFPENVSMEELSAIYQMAEIFVYPSFFEGFGIPIIEALFSGTPVIASHSSSLPEAGGPDSLYVNPHDISDIQSKIMFLWEHESERKRRAEKGLRYVQKFRDEEIAKNMMEIYAELLK